MSRKGKEGAEMKRYKRQLEQRGEKIALSRVAPPDFLEVTAFAMERRDSGSSGSGNARVTSVVV